MASLRRNSAGRNHINAEVRKPSTFAISFVLIMLKARYVVKNEVSDIAGLSTNTSDSCMIIRCYDNHIECLTVDLGWSCDVLREVVMSLSLSELYVVQTVTMSS